MGKPEPFPAQLAQPQHCSNKLEGIFFLLFASPLFVAALLTPRDSPSVPSRGECICCCSNAIPAHQVLQEVIKKKEKEIILERKQLCWSLDPREQRSPCKQGLTHLLYVCIISRT